MLAMTSGDTVASSFGLLTSAGGGGFSIPLPFKHAFTALSEWLPLLEGMLIGANILVAKLFIAPGVSFLCVVMKAVGV